MALARMARTVNAALRWPPAPFPTPYNTGATLPSSLVTVGTGYVTSGPGWNWSPGASTAYINTANAVFSGYRVLGAVSVNANNAIVKDSSFESIGVDGTSNTLISNCVAFGGSGDICVNLEPGATGTTIQNCTFSGSDSGLGRADYGIYANTSDPSLVITGCNIYQVRIGIATPNTGGYTITGCCIHDFGYMPADHTDGILIPGSATGTITGNSVLCQLSQTDAIIIAPGATSVSIQGNLLSGGSYTFYGGSSHGYASGVNVTNNWFTTVVYPRSGQFGPVAWWSDTGNTWSNNRWLDGPNAGQQVLTG